MTLVSKTYAIQSDPTGQLTLSGNNLNLTGAIPAGSYPVTVRRTIVEDFVQTLVVAAVVVGVSISGTPGAATVGAPYSFTPATANGSGTKAFTLTGSLPAGLSFSSSTGAITGTPTAAGTTSGLNITVTDASGSASLGAFSLAVSATSTIAAPIITWSSDVYHQLAVENTIVLDSGSTAGDVLTREFASDSGFATIIATQSHTLTTGDLSGGTQTGGGSSSWPALGSPLPAGSPLYMRVRQSHGAQALVSNIETKTLLAPTELILGTFPNISPAFSANSSISGSNLDLTIPNYQNAYLVVPGFNVGDKLVLTFTTSGTTGAPFNVADFLDNPPSYGGNKIATGISGAVTRSIDMTVTDTAGRIAPYFDAPGDMSVTFTALSLKKKVQ